MRITRRSVVGGGLGFLGASASPFARAEDFAPFEGIEDFLLASDAYVYGYPLVSMEMTRRVLTNVASSTGARGGAHGPDRRSARIPHARIYRGDRA
jgi:hypothetical protein